MTFLLWSWRKRQWWKPMREGYTPHVAYAGRYGSEEAAEIVLGGLPSTTAVDEEIAEKNFSDSAFADADTVERTLDEWRRI